MTHTYTKTTLRIEQNPEGTYGYVLTYRLADGRAGMSQDGGYPCECAAANAARRHARTIEVPAPACPLIAEYNEQIRRINVRLRQIPVGWRYDTEKDLAATIRTRDYYLRPHDCQARDCEWAMENLRRIRESAT